MKSQAALHSRTQQELRSELLLRRRNQSPKDQSLSSEKISRLLYDLVAQVKPRYIGSYAAILGEPLIELNLSSEQVCYPRVEGEKIVFYHSDSHFSGFEKGSFSVPEPPLDLNRKVELDQQDVVLVPGVVFNRQGHRIGMGKGFYDRFLEKCKAPAWGVAYSFQVVDEEWSLQAWDRPMDFLVTENYALDLNH